MKVVTLSVNILIRIFLNLMLLPVQTSVAIKRMLKKVKMGRSNRTVFTILFNKPRRSVHPLPQLSTSLLMKLKNTRFNKIYHHTKMMNQKPSRQ